MKKKREVHYYWFSNGGHLLGRKSCIYYKGSGRGVLPPPPSFDFAEDYAESKDVELVRELQALKRIPSGTGPCGQIAMYYFPKEWSREGSSIFGLACDTQAQL